MRLDKPRTEAMLRPLLPLTRWTLNATWTIGQLLGLGVGVRCYLKPDYFFIGAEDCFCLQRNPNPGSATVPHNDLGVFAGQYLFFRHDSPIRFGVAAGAGMILTVLWAPGASAYTDFYLNLLSPWVEWNLKRHLVYLRVDARYVLGWGRNLIGGSWFSLDAYGPPITLGVAWKW